MGEGGEGGGDSSLIRSHDMRPHDPPLALLPRRARCLPRRHDQPLEHASTLSTCIFTRQHLSRAHAAPDITVLERLALSACMACMAAGIDLRGGNGLDRRIERCLDAHSELQKRGSGANMNSSSSYMSSLWTFLCRTLAVRAHGGRSF